VRRLNALRHAAFQAALHRLEPRPAGRPVQPPEADPRAVALETELRELRLELQAARVRAELALALPHVLARAGRVKKSKPRPHSGRPPSTARRPST
jgi:hypothetical protein